MTTLIATFLIALFASLVMTRIMIPVSVRLGVVDKPDGFRKTHGRAVPRLGGIGIYLAFILPIVLLMIFRDFSQVSRVVVNNPRMMFVLFVGASMALGTGVLDDFLNLSARWKIVFQVLTATVMYASGFAIRVISNPFGESINLGWLAYPVTLFWFLGCMNAVNLLDGLDGLAAGTTVFVTVTLFLVCLHFGNIRGAVLMSALSGAILGFLVFNFPPARIFLGDCGSMLLGFLVAALSLVSSSKKAETAVALFIPVVALGLPILDTAIAIVRRWYKRLPISAPDRGHIHHMLVSMGYSQRRVVLILYGISLLLGGAALVIMMNRNEVAMMVIAALGIIAFVCIRLFSGVGFAQLMVKLGEDQERRRASFDSAVAVEKACRAIADSGEGPGGMWKICEDLFPQLGIVAGSLELGGESLKWRFGETEESRECKTDGWSMCLILRGPDDNAVGRLSVKGARNRIQPIPELPDMLDRLRSELSRKLCGPR